MKNTATTLIKNERFEQTNKHGYSAKHDDEINSNYQLQIAAKAIIEPNAKNFPIDWAPHLVNKMCSKSKIDRLVIAGAFYEAEIARVERLLINIKKEINSIIDPYDMPKCRYCNGGGCEHCDYFGLD